jgi:hypothetical protein
VSIRRVHTLITVAGALVMVGAAGCGSPAQQPEAPPPSAPARPALPPRPVELRLDGVDACTLLTDHQKHEFNIASGSSVANDSGPKHGSICLWTTYGLHPDNGWTGGTDLNRGADYALGREPLRSVDGFAATTTTSLGSDPNYYCAVLVDVAPGQALGADYSNESRDVPGMNRKMACDNAMRLASAMLATLRTLKQR